jgi:hypothetical protein
VTTGSYGPFPAVGFLVQGTFRGKTWNGSDGKYEVVGGSRRVKWNSYTLESVGLSCSQHQYKGKVYRLSDGILYDYYAQAPSVAFRPSFLTPGLAITDDLKQRALTKLLAKIKGHDFQLGVELGQLHQTTSLLVSNLGMLGRAALALKRGDFSTAARSLGARPRSTRLKTSDISGRWLELQYGWLPLLSSSFEVSKAFEEISKGPRKTVFVASGSATARINVSQSPTVHDEFVKGQKGRRLQYEMYEEMTVQRQLGLTDPLSIAWELTPWSFVIDWFFPIGTYLSNLNQIPTLKGRWLVTDFFKFARQNPNFVWKGSGSFGPGYNITSEEIPKAVFSASSRTRTFSSSPPPVPFPKFKLGGVNSTTRFWNAAALAYQRFR